MKNILTKLLATLSAVVILSSVVINNPVDLPTIPTQPPVSNPYEIEDGYDNSSSPQYDEPVVDDAVDA